MFISATRHAAGTPRCAVSSIGERDGIYIIDLLQTQALLDNARRFAGDVAHRGGTVLFVGHQEAGP